MLKATSSLHTIDCVGKNEKYHRKADCLPFLMFLCWWIHFCSNVDPASNAPSHFVSFFVSLHIFIAVHGSAFLGHFPQLQSNFDTSTIGDGAESSRLVLFDVLTNITTTIAIFYFLGIENCSEIMNQVEHFKSNWT